MMKQFIAIVLVSMVIAGIKLYFFDLPHRPTADELYGCTVKQQLPNGDCP